MVSFRSSFILAFPLVAATACAQDVQDDIFDPTTTGESSSSTTDISTSSTTDETATGSTGDEGSSSSTSGSTGEDTNGGQLCGDGSIDGTEQCDCGGGDCDASGLGNMGCADTTDPLNPERVLTGGTLGCNPASCQFIVDACTWCGDGTQNGNETCELEQTITTTCEAEGAGVVGTLTCDDTCQIDTAACTNCFIEETFDACPGDLAGWSVTQTLGQATAPTWECGATTAFGPGVGETGVWGTALDANYSNTESSVLLSPEIDLTAMCGNEGVTMTIRHWYDFADLSTNADGGIVQVSTDGTTWTTIAPTEGQAYSTNDITSEYPPVNEGPGFSAQALNEGMWLTSTFDISAYNDQTAFQVRFVFGSDTSSVAPGWYIDTFTIQGMGA
jgi:hypothetical protein